MLNIDAPTVGEIVAGLGHNNPPEPTPYEKIKAEIEDLYAEAQGWLDGAEVQTEGQAEAVGRLRDMLRAAGNRAEEQRKKEAKPFDDGKAEVQGRYNPLIQKDRGTVDRAVKACNAALAPFLRKKDEELREAARLEQERAAKLAAEARDAAQAAARSANLLERESAEEILAQAKDAMASMKRAEKEKPRVQGAARAIGLKSVWTPELSDPAAAIEHYRKVQPAALKEWMLEQARKDVRAGSRHIPGFQITETKVPA